MATARLTWFLAPIVLSFLPATQSAASSPRTEGRIAATITHDVAEMIAGINAHDPVRATMFDAPDIVSMESGRPPSVGAEADRREIEMAFHHSPDWRVRLIDEMVDVAGSGDMATYRGTYWQDSSNHGAAMTQRVNFIAGFRRERDGSWKIHWSVVCNQERPHPA